MKADIFNKLIELKQFDRGNGVTNFGFESKFKRWYIDFFVDGDNICQVGDFGYTNAKGEWVQEQPTEKQYEKMQSILDYEIQNWYEPRESFDKPIEDYYDYYGIKRENFY